MPTREEQIDAVLLSDVIEHVVNPVQFLSDLVRFPGLRNALFLVSVPNYAVWYNRLLTLAGRFEYAESGLYDRTHLRFFTRASVGRDAPAVYSRSHAGSGSSRLIVGTINGAPLSAPESPAKVATSAARPAAPCGCPIAPFTLCPTNRRAWPPNARFTASVSTASFSCVLVPW